MGENESDLLIYELEDKFPGMELLPDGKGKVPGLLACKRLILSLP